MKTNCKWAFGMMVAGMLLVPGSIASAAENVALDKPVWISPAWGVPGSAYAYWGWEIPAPALASPGTVNDGVFLNEGHQWNMDTLWWDDTHDAAQLKIDFEGDYWINRLVLQVDNNDEYHVVLLHNAMPQWGTTVPVADGWGMMTREVILPVPVLAGSLLFGHVDGGAGDSLYAISELQAFAVERSTVPAPAAVMLLVPGLLSLAGLRRRIGIH